MGCCGTHIQSRLYSDNLRRGVQLTEEDKEPIAIRKSYGCRPVAHLGVANGRTLVDHYTALRLEELDQGSRWNIRVLGVASRDGGARTVVPCGLEYPHALVHCGARISLIVRRIDGREQGDVHAERLRRQAARLSDRRAQSLRVRLRQRSEDSWPRNSVSVCVIAGLSVRSPRPPALETAAASLGTPTLCTGHFREGRLLKRD